MSATGGRAGKGSGRTACRHVFEESDRGIVPMNHSNHDGRTPTESEEGRLLSEENTPPPNPHLTRSGARVSQGLWGVRKAAKEHQEMRFTALLHHLTVDLLRESFYALKRKAALEDQIVQQAVVTILKAIYEEDFLGFSYGFRPGRNQHQALDALSYALMSARTDLCGGRRVTDVPTVTYRKSLSRRVPG